MVYFVLALWLFRGRNCGHGQVIAKLADGLYLNGPSISAAASAAAARRFPGVRAPRFIRSLSLNPVRGMPAAFTTIPVSLQMAWYMANSAGARAGAAVVSPSV